MRDYINRLGLCFAVFVLVACTNQQARVNRVNDRALCQQTCEQRLQKCNIICHNNCQECRAHANKSAAHNYEKLLNEKKIQGGIVTRELNSYRDPLQCRKTTCDCKEDYTVCSQSCDGLIHKRLQVAPVCC